MKYLSALLLALCLFLSGAIFPVQAIGSDPEARDLANSWRYEDGQRLAVPSVLTEPFHPEATLKGIDVSHHQGKIDWEAVRDSGIDFVILRCGFGMDQTDQDDRYFEYNASECERLGIPYGVYIYSYATDAARASSEADHVLRLISGHTLTYPVYFDMEDDSTIESDLASIARTFCDKIAGAGYSVGVYANAYWWNTYLTDPCFDNWHRWVAHYNGSCEYDGEYAMWQYSNMGTVPGIDGNVDLNYLIGYPADHGSCALRHIYENGVCAICGKVQVILKSPQITMSNDSATGKPQVSWKTVKGATIYTVRRYDPDTQRFRTLGTVSGTGFIDTDAVPGETCHYRVEARADRADEPAVSDIKSIVCDLPQPVISVSNVASSGKVRVTWEPIEGAVQYQVYRATEKDGPYSRVFTTTGTTYTNISAEVGNTYYYKIRAIHANSAASSAFSGVKARTCDLPRPVISVSNVASSGKVRVTWDAIEGAVQYQVYRAIDKNGPYSRVFTTTGTGYTNTSAQAGTTYYYKVRAIHPNSNANCAFSGVKARTCDLPRPVISVSNVASSGKVRVTWTAIDGAEKYQVYRATEKDGPYSRVFTTTGTTYTNISAEVGNTYYYKIRAIHATSAAGSAFSGVKARTCDLPRPDVSITRSNTGKPKLTWDAVEGAVSYKVYRSSSKTGTFKLLKTITGTSFINTSATAGTTFYYKVVAVHPMRAANSAPSAVVAIKSK